MASFMASTTSSVRTWFALAVITAVLIVAPPTTAEAVISCNSMLNTLNPCLNFVVFGGHVPPRECCNGLKSVNNAAATTEDRQAVCSCLKTVAGSATSGIIINAAALPEKCGVSFSYVISPSTDCSRVS